MKRDLKTILTLSFAAAGIYMTIAWLIKPEVAFIPVYLSIFAYYFNRKDSVSTLDIVQNKSI